MIERIQKVEKCRVCGGNPTIYKTKETGGWIAECLNKNCSFKTKTDVYKETSDAIAAWNKIMERRMHEKDV